MKHLLLTLSLFFSLQISYSQSCIPDTTNFNLFSITQDSIPCIIRTEPYFFPNYFYVPDTFFGVQVFNAKVTSIIGLPSGLSYSCSPPNCQIQANQHGVVCITGTTSDTTGLYSVTFSGNVSTAQGTFSLSQIEQFGGPPVTYVFTVIDSNETCSDTLASSVPKYTEAGIGLSCTPNPAHGSVLITWSGSASMLYVTDISGREVHSLPLAQEAKKSVVIQGLQENATGVYFVTLKSEEGLISKKLILY